MYIAGRLRTASMPPRTLIDSAVYSLLELPLPPLIGVTLPFFVVVSAMGVLISLVAIPLRENVRICSCERLVRMPCFGWVIRLDPGSISKRLQSTQVIEIANT